MPNIDPCAKRWQSQLAKDFGATVKTWRRTRRLSAVKLSDMTKELGYPIHRTAISRIENNLRDGKLDVAEVLVLSAALRVPAADLLFRVQSETVEALPNRDIDRLAASLALVGIPDARTAEDLSNELDTASAAIDRAREQLGRVPRHQ